MMRSLQTLLLSTALAATAALAQPAPPRPPPAPPAPAAAPVQAGKRITLKYDGTLGEALKKIAEKGGINLILTGKLDEPAEVFLTDVSAEEALGIVAQAHRLHVLRQGSIWTVRPMSQSEAALADQETLHDPQLEAAGLAAARAAEHGLRQQEVQERIREQTERRMEKQARQLERIQNRYGKGRDVAGYGTIVVPEGKTVENAVSYGGPLEVYGHVEGDAVSFGGPVKLGANAVVEGDVVAFGGPIVKEEGAVIEGDEIAMGGAHAGLSIARGMRGFRGNDSGDDEDEGAVKLNHRPIGSGLPGFLLWFAALFAVGFVTMMAAPNQMKRMESQIVKNPLRTGVTGLVSLVALPVLSVLLTLTIVGAIPVLLFWFLLVPVGMAAGTSALANEIGMRLPLKNVRKTQALVLALGLLILLAVFHIPVLGPLTMVVVGLLSLGAISRMMLESAHRRRQGVPEPM
ncbi:MAG: polymer-forming cytoskeletal protein [Myxococcota bacterium]|nr:polymer-forming cytoskeletal protein [Myxococcota bacterium]